MIDDMTKGRISAKIQSSLEKNSNSKWKIEMHNVIAIFANFIQIQQEMSPPDQFKISINLRRLWRQFVTSIDFKTLSK